MKYKIAAGYIAAFWLVVFLAGLWTFKMLTQASPSVEWVAGLFGGAVFAIIMRELGNTAVESIKDFIAELKAKD